MSESKQQKKLPLSVAFDIESKGASLDHPVPQIGVAYGTCLADIKTASFCFDYSDYPFEKRCLDEFWVNHQDIYKRIEKEAIYRDEQWKKFGAFIDELEVLSNNVEIVSDNPAFDIARIDYNTDLHGVRNRFYEMSDGSKQRSSIPLRYTRDGKYRPVKDPSERIKGLPKAVQAEIQAAVKKAVKNPHWAEDDATGILTMHFLVRDAIAKVV